MKVAIRQLIAESRLRYALRWRDPEPDPEPEPELPPPEPQMVERWLYRGRDKSLDRFFGWSPMAVLISHVTDGKVGKGFSKTKWRKEQEREICKK